MAIRGLVLVILSVASTAFGRDMAVYTVRAGIPGTGNLTGDKPGLAYLGGGWKCWAEASIESEKVVKDYQGQPTTIRSSVPIPLDYSLMVSPSVETTANVEVGQEGPVALVIGEVCLECHTTYYTTYSNGKSERHSRTDCSRDSLQWTCPIGRDRHADGSLTNLDCRLTYEDMSRSRPSAYLKKLKDAGMKASITQKDSGDRVELDLCKGRTENRSVVRLRQGTGGHKGENDFVFVVKLGDERPIELKSHNGILDYDISFCPYDPTVNVKVSAYENDVFFDDRYVPVKQGGIDFLLAGGNQSAEVELQRKSYFGYTPKKSVVTVDFQGPAKFSGDVEAPLEASAGKGPVPLTASVGGTHRP